MKNGFTYLECMVCVAIVALLTALFIPAVMNAKKRRLEANNPVVEQSQPNSITVNGKTYYEEKQHPEQIILDGITYKRVR